MTSPAQFGMRSRDCTAKEIKPKLLPRKLSHCSNTPQIPGETSPAQAAASSPKQPSSPGHKTERQPKPVRADREPLAAGSDHISHKNCESIPPVERPETDAAPDSRSGSTPCTHPSNGRGLTRSSHKTRKRIETTETPRGLRFALCRLTHSFPHPLVSRRRPVRAL